MPISLVSDKDPRFTSNVWRELIKIVGTQLKMYFFRHQQTDEQTEQMNKVLEKTLGFYVHPRQDDWDLRLRVAEFSCN